MAGLLALGLTLGAVPASAQEDTTPPTLVRGEIDGGTMTLFFSEALVKDAVSPRLFRVNVLRCPPIDCGRSFTSRGEVKDQRQHGDGRLGSWTGQE